MQHLVKLQQSRQFHLFVATLVSYRQLQLMLQFEQQVVFLNLMNLICHLLEQLLELELVSELGLELELVSMVDLDPVC